MCAVAPGRLAVASGPVAGERVEERRDAERVERHHVDEQTAREARDGAGHRAAEERDREQGEQQDVGGAAGDVEGREQRHLEDGGDEDADGDGEVVAHGSSGGGRLETSTITESSPEKSTSDWTSTCW